MDSKTLASTIANFSYKFCNELPASKSTVSSPLSAEILLALVTLGCSKVGHDELLKALGLPDDESIRASFSSVATSLKAVQGVTLNVANKIYIKDGSYELMPQLKDDAVKVFDAALEKINFNESAAAANTINSWVEGKTNNRIKDLIKADDLDPMTRLVLVNALYFKGTWKNKFDSRNTQDLPFHVTKTSTVNIPMMFKSDKFKYGESTELQAQLLELPYVGEGASMLVVLPNEVDGLAGLLGKLAGGYDLTTEVDKLHLTKVDVTLPKFKIETEIDLGELLPKLGIKAIFDSGSSCLDRVLSNGEPLFVSKAIQKAFIEVNEEGAEAAAATGAVMMLRCAMSPRFRADRPFFYALRSAATTLFVAMGIMAMSAMILPPTPRFVADHPYLVAILVHRSPIFLATFYGK